MNTPKRTLFGSLAAAAVLATAFGPQAIAAPSQDDGAASSKVGMLGAMQRDLGLTKTQATDRLASEAKAAKVDKTLEKSLGADYAGSWYDAKAGTLVVAVTDASQAGAVKAQGAQVRTVGAGSTAGEAGLQEGDIIPGIDDRAITSADSLVAPIRSYRPGDEVTGATTFRIVKAMDAGPTFGVMTERIRETDTAGDLLTRLAEGGAGLLVTTLDGIEDGVLVPREQPEEGISMAPKILVEDAKVDWTEPAQAVDRRIRACTPFPGAWSVFEGERIKIGPVTLAASNLEPGEIAVGKNHVLVGTGTSAVRLGEVKAFGKKLMSAADWARGARLEDGARLGD